MQVSLQQFVPAAFMPEQNTMFINDLFIDSRDVVPGSGFVALRGAQVDGRDYIASAIERGAQLVFADLEGYNVPSAYKSTLLHIPELEGHVAAMAADFYDHPSLSINTIAVTGTNGKTSVCSFVAQAMQVLLGPCAYMGTLGWGVDELQPLANTTPDVVSVQRILRSVAAKGARSIAMEVSSHGIHQGRIEGVAIDVAVFTNLSRDHIDYHGDMASYAEVKRRLFSRQGLQCAVINVDDETGCSWIDELRSECHVLTYSAERDADIRLINAEYSLAATKMQIAIPCGEITIELPVVGRFNVYNLLATCAVLCHYNNEPLKIQQAMQAITGVAGRMELVGNGRPAVVVDYAHTPDGLESALCALKPHCSGQLWVVFGCGGDRDAGKRPMMGEVAERLADNLVITSDNPRSEDPQAIIDAILTGLVVPQKAKVYVDREEAIKFVIANAEENDCVLIAGKGHEDYQILASGVIGFDDREIAKKILQEVSV